MIQDFCVKSLCADLCRNTCVCMKSSETMITSVPFALKCLTLKHKSKLYKDNTTQGAVKLSVQRLQHTEYNVISIKQPSPGTQFVCFLEVINIYMQLTMLCLMNCLKIGINYELK